MKNATEDQITKLLATGETPPQSIVPGVLIRTDLADAYTTVDGPIGPLHVAFTTLGVSAVVPTINEAEFLDVHARTVGRPAYRSDMMPKKLAGSLTRALDTGKLGKLPVDLRQLSDFQRAVLEVTAHIPPGEVRPYGWVAREMGNEGAVRAVGSALGRNPVPIVIPCHRVGEVGRRSWQLRLRAADEDGTARARGYGIGAVCPRLFALCRQQYHEDLLLPNMPQRAEDHSCSLG